MTRESYVDEVKTTMLSTSIFEVPSGNLVWVGRSKSFDVESIGDGADDLAYAIIGNIHN